MRLAISNIAWDSGEDSEIAALLRQYQIDAIDVAPGKYFADLAKTTISEIAQVRAWWSDRGIEIIGMQALLFGTSGMNVFGPPDVRLAMLQYLKEVCRVGAVTGATRLVFGSPRNRDRSGLSDEQANAIATDFFRRLGDIAEEHHVVFCLEPNPTCYGSNFMTNSAETALVVRNIDHVAIKMQLDVGALTINREDAATTIAELAPIIGHIHASEPDLRPLGDLGTDHHSVRMCLQKHLPDSIVSIEMLATQDEPHVVSIERALAAAVRYYRT
jgi:sugar phosphate isomerase/epimerase